MMTNRRFIYAGRLLCLAIATFSGVWFLLWLGVVISNYRQMPGIVTQSDVTTTAVLGTVFVSFLIGYLSLARATKKR